METNKQIENKINRESAKEQGFYDGRFKPRVVPDKKKKESKTKARKKISNDYND